ncbi:MAG: ABC transporter ATP-binding protein [Clostridia bacterium]|nr:ABC transporter ATP-binding protein [Clostridia bacterium]
MLDIKNLTVRYGGNSPILNGISLTLPKGITVLIGQNGAGKSTLLRAILGEVSYTGSIFASGKDLSQTPPRERARLLSLLPQQLPAPALSSAEVISLGFAPYVTRLGDRERQTVRDILQRLGITQLAERPVSTLSGGERQKVFLGMLLAQDTPILLLDEPTTHMDATAVRELREILLAEAARGKQILLVMHDLGEALSLADHVLLLENARIAFDGTPQACIEQKVPEKHFGLSHYTARAENGEVLHFYKV